MRKAYTVIFSVVVIILVGVTVYLLIKRDTKMSPDNSNSQTYSYKVTTNNTGMASMAGATYSGTTKVDIYSGNKLILSLSGADGMGSDPLCPTVATFSDTPASYALMVKDGAMDKGSDVSISDFSSADYTELTLLGRRARIVNNTIYFDKMLNDDPSTFIPECGFRATYVNFPKIKFNTVSKNNVTGTENLYKVDSHLELLTTGPELKNFADYLSQISI